MSLKEPKGRPARWMVEIQDFNFTVKYAPGHKIQEAYTLSRDFQTRRYFQNAARKSIWWKKIR